MLEVELAKTVVQWLTDQEWEVYQEVQMQRYGRVADIVAVKDGRLWAIECKTSLSIAVMEQAFQWKSFANWSSIAVPIAKNRQGAFCETVCRHFGIGMLKVDKHGYIHNSLAPQLNRKAMTKFFRLNDHQKTWAAAGNANGSRWTPFGETCMNLARYVKEHPRCSLKVAITGIKTHYRKDTTAISCMRKWLELGKVKGVRVEYSGGKMILVSV